MTTLNSVMRHLNMLIYVEGDTNPAKLPSQLPQFHDTVIAVYREVKGHDDRISMLCFSPNITYT